MSGKSASSRREIEEIYPLTPMQEGMLFHALLAPGGEEYFEQLNVRIEGELDGALLRRAFGELTAAHGILRTGFNWEKRKEPFQIVYRAVEVPWVELDWRGGAEDAVEVADVPEQVNDVAARERRVEAFLAEDRRRGFDLGAAPVMRVTVIRFSDTSWQVTWSHHHLLLDGWSRSLLVQEWLERYRALRSGGRAAVVAARAFKNYVAWLKRQDAAAAEAFWKGELAGFEGMGVLGLGRVNTRREGSDGVGEGDGARGGEVETLLSGEESRALREFAAGRQLTMSTVAQGAWLLLLGRLAGTSEPVCGVTVSGRPAELPGVEAMVGLFINTLPLRVAVDPARRVGEWLEALQKKTAGLRRFESTPLAKIQRWAGAGHDQPLFESIFVFENYPVDPAANDTRAAGFRLAGVSAFERTSYPLTVVVTPGERMGVRLLFDGARFDEGQARRLVGYYVEVLRGMIAGARAGEVRLGELGILPAEEREMVVRGWNLEAAGGSADGSGRWAGAEETGGVCRGVKPLPQWKEERCLDQLCAAQAGRTPEAVALVAGTERISYRELEARAEALAEVLRVRGVGAAGEETLVGICLERTPALVVAMLAVLKAGGAYVPLDPKYPRERVAYMLEDARARVVITQAGLRGRLPEVVGVEWVDVEGDAEERMVLEVPALTRRATRTDSLAYVIYTSGSTGRPKGTAIEHRSAVAFVEWARAVFPAEALRGVLFSTSVCFDLSIFEVFVTLACGGTIVLAEDALALETLAARDEVTLINTVPSAMAELLRLRAVPAGVRTINLAGEPLTAALADRIYAETKVVDVYDLYGPSEDTTYSTFTRREPGGPATIGRPIAGTQLYLLDQYGQPVPVGVVGELFLGGAGLARGYLGRADLTAERFVPDPFGGVAGGRLYRTGDLARFMADGRVEFLGRGDHQVKIRGFRIELGEIQTRLEKHPAIADVTVVARDEAATNGGAGGKRIVAYVVVAAGVESGLATDEGWRAYLAKELPHYMIPAVFVRLETLPRTPNGKVDRKALPAPESVTGKGALENARDGAGGVARRLSATEEIVAGVWSDVLGGGAPRAEDDFFEVGGHSLLATQLVSRLREVFRLEVPLRVVFEVPALGKLAAWIERALQTRAGVEVEHVAFPSGTNPAEAPLSHAQRRLWFFDQLQPGNPAYHIPAVFRLRGRVDIGALERSVADIVRRHAVLRTTFGVRDGEPVLRVGEGASVRVEVDDVSAVAGEAEERERRAREIVRAETRRSFNLETGPLLRVRCVRVSEAESWLVVTMHHIASDGWSVEVFVRELVGGLEAEGGSSKLQDPSLPAFGGSEGDQGFRETAGKVGGLKHQYVDFAVWQRAWLQGERLERQVEFWRKKLEGMPQVLELPADRVRPAVPSFRGAAVAFELPAATVKALRELGRQEGATPFMVLLAGFQILMARLAGQDDVAIGTPVANRHRAEVEPLIGFFVNTLVMRARPEAGLTFRRWVRRVRDDAIDAFTHQDLPFDLLVERMNVERDLARNPLFQVVFSAQPTAVARREVAGLTLEPVALAPESVRFDLECHMEVDTSAVRGQFVYATDLFDETRVRRMVEQFVVVLEAAGGRADGRIGELTLLRAEETQRVVEAWNATTTAYPREATVHGLFAEQAAKTPDAVAVTCGGETLTYGELERRANALARRLRKEGVGRETPVALGFERSFAMLVAQLAVLKAGGFFVPIDPELPVERVRAMMAEVRIEIVVTGEKFAGRWAEEKGGGSRGVKPLPQVLVVDGVEERDAVAVGEVAAIEEWNEAMDLAYVMFTSGSTGGPKGVGVPHRAVVRLVRETNFARFGADEVMLQLAPYSFDAATLEFWGALLNGGRLAIFPPGTPSVADIADFVRREQVTTMWLTAGLFHAVAEHAPEAFRGVRQLLAGGDVLLPEDCRRVLAANPGLTLINGYGPTESTTFACCHAMAAAGDVGEATVPIGRPIANTRVYVLDTALNPCAVGVPGELFIGGDGLARGYVGQAALTAEKFLPDPFSRERGARLYRTGDRVRWTEAGRIEFLGRTDFQVKIRGFRIELAEIEAALGRQPMVKEGAVVARADGPGVKRLVAYVVARAAGAAAFDREALMAALRRELPDYMVPGVVVVLDALPLNANGKVDRKALREIVAAGVGDGGVATAVAAGATAGSGDPALHLHAVGEVEARIAGIWKDVLRVPAVGRDENFFGLGGDSILSIQIVARARAAGLLLTPAQLFQHQTVAELARVAVPVDGSAGTWAAVTGEVALTPVQRWWLGGEPVDAHHFNQAVLLEVARPMSREAVEKVLGALDAHHDLLRGRLVPRGSEGESEGESGGGGALRRDDAVSGKEKWRFEIVAAFGREVPLRWVELSGVSEAERGAAVEAVCAEEQGRLKPEGGVMWRAVYFDFGDGRAGRLFVVVHHLVVDGVSWRILHEDLERVAAQVSGGEAIALPAKTTSFKAWSERLGGAVKAGMFEGEKAFWMEAAQVLASARAVLPRDFAAGDEANVEGTAMSVVMGLDAAETERLLKDVPARRGVSVEAALLACAVEAIGAWSGAGEVTVAMEGHGREEIFPEVDLSRTVGWFTAIYPLRVVRPAGVERVAAQLRAVPRRGVGYGVLRYLGGAEAGRHGGLPLPTEPEVSFNYLGRFDTGADGAGMFAAAREERGAFVSPRARRHHVLEINGNVVRGELSVAWTFSRALHREETIGRVATDFIGRVRALVREVEAAVAKEVSERDEAIAEVEFN